MFRMVSCKPTLTTIVAKVPLTIADDSLPDSPTAFRELVGSL